MRRRAGATCSDTRTRNLPTSTDSTRIRSSTRPVLFGEGTSAIFNYQGKYDEEAKKIIMHGSWAAPRAKVIERMEVGEPRDGKQIFTVYGAGEYGGKKIPEHVHLVLTYTKRGKKGSRKARTEWIGEPEGPGLSMVFSCDSSSPQISPPTPDRAQPVG